LGHYPRPTPMFQIPGADLSSLVVSPHSHRGRFITFEGLDGCGKSTQMEKLASVLRAQGLPVVVTREPGGTAFGDRMRAAFVATGASVDPLAEAFALNASRAQLVVEVIEPALREGSWVLCDRFTTATLAYQGFGRGLDLAVLRELGSIATRGVEPDCILLLDIPVALSRTRVAARVAASGIGKDRLEREDDGFHQRVRDGYLQLASEDARIHALDGTLSPEELVRAAWGQIESLR
ncbi:MAG TPA: dTMP kinase, partial [Candidatus Baltobacteraceae bacterium]|nr:dTMP kinase [Candidatus Baltobacteraceae bacterium]